MTVKNLSWYLKKNIILLNDVLKVLWKFNRVEFHIWSLHDFLRMCKCLDLLPASPLVSSQNTEKDVTFLPLPFFLHLWFGTEWWVWVWIWVFKTKFFWRLCVCIHFTLSAIGISVCIMLKAWLYYFRLKSVYHCMISEHCNWP